MLGGLFPGATKVDNSVGHRFSAYLLEQACAQLDLGYAGTRVGDAARERELKRIFILPILLEAVASENLPAGLSDRLSLKLIDQDRSSVEDLTKKITMKLFQLVVESYSSLRLEVPSRKSLISLRDELTAGQAKLLGYLVEKRKDGSEIAQRQIEQGVGYSLASAELYYRLESLIQQGFVHKRRIATDGQFSYALTEEFRSQMGKP